MDLQKAIVNYGRETYGTVTFLEKSTNPQKLSYPGVGAVMSEAEHLVLSFIVNIADLG